MGNGCHQRYPSANHLSVKVEERTGYQTSSVGLTITARGPQVVNLRRFGDRECDTVVEPSRAAEGKV